MKGTDLCCREKHKEGGKIRQDEELLLLGQRNISFGMQTAGLVGSCCWDSLLPEQIWARGRRVPSSRKSSAWRHRQLLGKWALFKVVLIASGLPVGLWK